LHCLTSAPIGYSVKGNHDSRRHCPKENQLFTKLNCRYCNLELDLELPKDYFVARSSEEPEEEESVSEEDKELTRLLFTSQHILACGSLRNRRAMFRCWTWGQNEKDVEFRALEEFVENMASALIVSRSSGRVIMGILHF
jgi:hypothetical protein